MVSLAIHAFLPLHPLSRAHHIRLRRAEAAKAVSSDDEVPLQEGLFPAWAQPHTVHVPSRRYIPAGIMQRTEAAAGCTVQQQ